ncbi:FecR family protein [Pusillimonas noertemannii]|uniref:FecR family protein n=1 Tax=Pusillimonas noertemannii TaxID=305977 RepID=A0A2U1CLF6_9BURK|nr:FecR family protein [Pusillimonas noertemannii]NYT69357.1 FecR family protein [Pusillimonas noertemannii]PVY61823.1 FecR family protein [Pusillimonas noertemannii]TFL09754.1 FecR family protein [Pusillimonas noertemannii]
MNPDNPNSSELREQAVHWFTRMHAGDATPEEIAACKAWRQENPEHERLYRGVEFFWDASDQLPRDRLRAILAKPDQQPSKRRALTRRQFALGLAGAGALGVAAAVAVPTLLREEAQYRSTLATLQGERREITLPDGSTLTLNVNTQIDVVFYERRRIIELVAGEVFSVVEPDSQRPFIVLAGNTEVKVTGTRFDVWREHDEVNVSVESGSVAVTSGAWWSRDKTLLQGGQSVAIGRDGVAADVEAVQVENVATWREGKIVFDNAPLGRVVAEMGRYLPQPVRLDAPGLRDYRVAGVFNVDDPDAMIAALPAIAPVQVYRLTDGRIRIVAR